MRQGEVVSCAAGESQTYFVSSEGEARFGGGKG